MVLFLTEEFSSDLKKDQYRKYLEDHQIIEKLTEIFDCMQVAEVKPDNPMDFIREQLGIKIVTKQELDDMEQTLYDLHREKRKLRGVLRKLGVGDEQIDASVVFPQDNDFMEPENDMFYSANDMKCK